MLYKPVFAQDSTSKVIFISPSLLTPHNLGLVGSLFFLATSYPSEELELNPGPLTLEVTYLAIRPGLFV